MFWIPARTTTPVGTLWNETEDKYHKWCFAHPNTSSLPTGVFPKENVKSGKDAHFTYFSVPDSEVKHFMLNGSSSPAFIYRQDKLGIQETKHHTQGSAVLMTTWFSKPLTTIFFSLCSPALGSTQQAMAPGVQLQSSAGTGDMADGYRGWWILRPETSWIEICDECNMHIRF